MKQFNVRWQVQNDPFIWGIIINQKDVVVQLLGWRFSINTALLKLNLASKSVVNSDS